MRIENEKERLDQLLQAIQRIISGDRTQMIKVSDTDDDLLPIEVGLNVLIKDINYLIQEHESEVKQLQSVITQRDETKKLLEEKVTEFEKAFRLIVDREMKMSQLKAEVDRLKRELAIKK